MTKEKLQGIINLKNGQAIERAIRGEGYFDMAKHPTLKKVSLVPIAQSESLVSLDWINSRNYYYQANFADDVKEYPNQRFIWLQINKYNKRLNIYLPHVQKVFYKEK